MSGIEQLSDEELRRIAGIEAAPQPTAPPSIQDLSDDELKAIAQGIPSPERGFGTRALETVGAVGDFIDKYTGAPSRAAFDKLVRDDPGYRIAPKQPAGVPLGSSFLATEYETPKLGAKPLGESVPAAASAFASQFGADPHTAPTGKELANRKFGLSTEDSIPIFKYTPLGALSSGIAGATKPITDNFQGLQGVADYKVSPAGLGGLGLDMVIDVSNIVPVGTVLRGGAKATGAALKWSAKVARLEKPAAMVAESTKKAANAFAKMVKPSVADDFAELTEIAKKHGIEPQNLPPEVEFGEKNIITRLEKVQRQGIAGDDLVNQFEESLNTVRDAMKNKIDDIGGGTSLNYAEAGEKLVEDYNESFKALLDSQDVTYKKIIDEYQNVLDINPESQKILDSKLRELKSFANRRSNKAATDSIRSQAEQLKRTIENVNKNNKFSEYVQFMRDIGEVAFKKGKNTLELNPPDIKKLQELYFSIRETLIDTIRRDLPNGKEVANQLEWSNFEISKILDEKSVLSRVIGDGKRAPEDVFKAATKNTRTIDALDAILTPEQMKSVKAAYLSNMIREGKGGEWSFANFRNAMRKDKLVLERMLEPEELADIADLVRLGDRHGYYLMNSSRTAEMGGIKKALTEIFSTTSEIVTNDVVRQKLKDYARGVKQATDAAKEAPPVPPRYFGPGAIGPTEAFGLRLPAEVSRQQQNRRNESRAPVLGR